MNNVAPVITAPMTQGVLVNTETAIPGISVDDIDSATLTVTLTATQGTVSANGGSGTSLMFTDTLANLNTILAGVKFTPTLNVVGTGSNLEIKADDSVAPPVTKDIVITVLGNTYQTWRFGEFPFGDVTDPAKESTVWGDLAKPGYDIFENLFKFLHGLDPNTPSFDPQIILGTTENGGQTYATYSFKKRKDLDGATLTCKVGDDHSGPFTTLTTASPQFSTVEFNPVDPEFEIATFTDDTPVGEDAPRFGIICIEADEVASSETFVTTCLPLFGIEPNENQHFNFLAQTALQPRRFAGTVTAISATELEDSMAAFAANAFSDEPHFVFITSGSGVGLTANIDSHDPPH